MAIPTVQAVGSASAGTGPITVTLPTHAADDILLVVHETNQSTAPAAPTDWAVLAQYAQGSNVTTVTVYWRRATGAGTTNPTFTDPGNHQIGAALVIRGCITTGNPWDYTPSGEGQSGTTTFATTGQTTTVDDCLVFGVISDNTDTASDQMSGEANANLSSFTKRGAFYTTQGNGGGVIVYTGGLATAGSTGSFSGNIATTSAWAGVTFALKPAAGDVQVSPPAAALTLAGLAPTVTGTATVAAPAGALALSGLAPTVTGGATVTAPAAALALDGLAPTATGDATVNAPVGDITLDGAAPTVAGSATVAAPAATLTLGGLAPTATAGATVAAPAGDIALDGLAPVVSGGAGTGATVNAPTATLALTGLAPTVTGTAAVAAPTATLALAGLAPTITGSAAVTAPTGSLALAGNAPTITGGATIAAPLADLALAGLAPTVTGAAVVSPPAAMLTLAGLAPTVTTAADTDPLGPVAGGPDTPHWAGSAAGSGWGGSANGDRWSGGPGFQDIGGGA